MSERRFTEQQVAEIIRRAAEAQRGSPPGETTHGTLSASEVLRIGTELGVDPAALQAAMGDTVTWTSHDDPVSFFQMERAFERRIPVALADEDFAEVMGLFPSLGLRSAVIHTERGLTYTAHLGMTQCIVTLTGSEEDTRLKIRVPSHDTWGTLVFVGLALSLFLAVMVFGYFEIDMFPLGIRFDPVLFVPLLVLVGAFCVWVGLSSIRSANRRIARLMDEFAIGKAERARMRSTTPRLGASALELESDYQPEELRLNQTEDGR